MVRAVRDLVKAYRVSCLHLMETKALLHVLTILKEDFNLKNVVLYEKFQ